MKKVLLIIGLILCSIISAPKFMHDSKHKVRADKKDFIILGFSDSGTPKSIEDVWGD